VLSWGWGGHGLQGRDDPEQEDALFPVVLACLDAPAVAIASGYYHSVVLTRAAPMGPPRASHCSRCAEKGTVYTWGRGHFGHLGHGTTADRAAPTPVAALAGKRVARIAAGGFFTVAVDGTPAVHAPRRLTVVGRAAASGSVWAWGYNHDGELGTGSTEEFSATPAEVAALKGRHVTAVACGGSHALFSTSACAVACVWCGFADGRAKRAGSCGRSAKV
jgi:alpha-tubulin suppressor-like RCC1 family protein